MSKLTTPALTPPRIGIALELALKALIPPPLLDPSSLVASMPFHHAHNPICRPFNTTRARSPRRTGTHLVGSSCDDTVNV